jgi:hypothetical protein
VGKMFRLAPRDCIGGRSGAAVSNCIRDWHDLLVADNVRMRETFGKSDPDDPLPKTCRRGHTRD